MLTEPSRKPAVPITASWRVLCRPAAMDLEIGAAQCSRTLTKQNAGRAASTANYAAAGTSIVWTRPPLALLARIRVPRLR
jgi:hypothetical protein